MEDLIRHGADPNARDGYEWTPLFHAAEHASVDAARCLLEHGADVQTRCNTGDTPLHYASFNMRTDCKRSEGRTAMVELLLQHHSEIEAKNEVGNTPLVVAIQMGEVAVVRPLLQAGARTDLRDGDGKPLMILARETLAHSKIAATIEDENRAAAKARIPGLKQIINMLSSIPGSTHPTEPAPDVQTQAQKRAEP